MSLVGPRALLALAVMALSARAGDEPLALRAQALADEGRRLEAFAELQAGLAAGLPGLAGASPREEAEAEVAALLLAALASELQAWPEAAACLPGLRAAGPPPAVDAPLARLQAEALRAVGDVEGARALAAAQGLLADVLVLGPFDNERGSGLPVALAPEAEIDLEAALEGKQRLVRWRPNPCPEHPLRRLLLHEMLQPNRQALAYVATALRADAPRPVVLRLGGSCAFAVFLNGVELARRNVHRPHEADQDLVVLPLQAGWNQLLLKTGVEDQPWTLELRLTDLQGAPLVDVPASAARVATPEPALREATRAALAACPAPEAGARDVLAAAPDPDGLRLLALWRLLVHPDDFSDRSAREPAERAAAAQPGHVAGLYLLARAHEPQGEDRTEMQVNPRLAALKAVLARRPEHLGALLDLAAFALRDNPTPDRVDELSARAVSAAPWSWPAASLRAQFLRERGRDAEALRALDDAAGSPEALLLPSAALHRSDRRLRAGDLAGAEAELRAALARRQLDGPVLGTLVDLLADTGRAPEALELTRRVLDASPFETGRRLATAERLEHAGLPDEARELVQQALVVAPDLAPALRLRARLLERDGELDTVQADLRAVLELDPGDDNARRHLQLLAAGAERERFEEPYREDALALVGTPLPAGEGEPAECLRRTSVWRLHPDGSEHLYEHLVLRVLDEGGVRALDGVPIPAQGGAVTVHNVRVIRPDGSFERAPPARGRGRWYDLPPLRVGDLVDLEYRVDQDDPDVFGRYFGLRHGFYPDLLDGLVPVREATLVVLAPPELPVHPVERRGAALERSERTLEGGLRELRWTLRDLPRPAIETAMPRREELGPGVDVTTFRDWDAFAAWWWAFIEKEFVTTPAMRDKVRELTAGLETEAQRVAAIVRFVGQEVRYNAWPFGTHGYEPFSAATIFERRFGDCKDKSILLRQMLAEIGVDAVPVLIRAESVRADEPLQAAMVEHFNHCIAWVQPTAQRPGYWLDATADRNPLEYLREDDQGARVLHVTPQGGEIREIPFAPPGANALVRRWEVDLAPDGSGTLRLRDESSGSFGVALRQRFGGETGDLPARLAQALAPAFGPVRVLEARTSVLEDIAAPAWLEARFEAQALWTAAGAARELRAGFDDLGLDGLATEPPAERVHDVVLDRPFAHDTVVLWRLPPGAQPAELPADVELQAPGLLSYMQRTRAVPGGIEVSRRFELHARRVPVAQYAAFREALQQVRLAEARGARLTPAPEGEGLR